jgi:hypothetical protein
LTEIYFNWTIIKKDNRLFRRRDYMLIISETKDYYDSINSFGIDKQVVYNRKEEVLKMPRQSGYRNEFRYKCH